MGAALDEWAAQFICPNCGRCNNEMVMTTKSCLCCGARLIHNGPDVRPKRTVKQGKPHAAFCASQDVTQT